MVKESSPLVLKRTLTLILAILHFTAGITILMVASWFIVACSVAGASFNYMLPAVVIRALALIRIASGYGYMLVGHSELLQRIGILRLRIFSGLKNKTKIKRSEHLDSLHHHSEEVASIWISWVSQNVGIFISLILLNVCMVFLVPELTYTVLAFSVAYGGIYIALLLSLIRLSTETATVKANCQIKILQHIETASIWHLHKDIKANSPSLLVLKGLEQKAQSYIRFANLVLFVISLLVISNVLFYHSAELTGTTLFIVLLMSLLSINDWLTPTLSNQTKLLQYINSNNQITKFTDDIQQLSIEGRKISGIKIADFMPEDLSIKCVNASFPKNSISVFLGSSGVGKSRTLQAINGLISCTGSRELRFYSEDVFHDVTKTTLLADCLYVEQFPYVLADTLKANLAIANYEASDTQMLLMLRKVGLGYLNNLDLWLGENGTSLSGGEKKRLGLARALLSKSSLILLDEPFEALDNANIEQIVNVINELKNERIILIATHIAPLKLKVDQTLKLDSGFNKSRLQAATRRESES